MEIKYLKTTEALEKKFGDSIIELFKDFSNKHQLEWKRYEHLLRLNHSNLDKQATSQLTKAIEDLNDDHVKSMDKLYHIYLYKCCQILEEKQNSLVESSTQVSQQLYTNNKSSSTNNHNTNNYQDTLDATSKSFKCPYQDCDKEYQAHNYWCDHIRKSHNGKPWKCDECNQTFSHQKKLKRHRCGSKYEVNEQENIQEFLDRQHECNECDYATKSSKDYCNHISTNHKDLEQTMIDSKLFTICSKCKNTYFSYERHSCRTMDITSNHQSEDESQSEASDKDVKTQKQKLDYAELKVSMTRCPECDVSRKRSRDVYAHIRKQHKELEKDLIEHEVFKICGKCQQSYHCIQKHTCKGNRKDKRRHLSNNRKRPRTPDSKIEPQPLSKRVRKSL